MIVRSLRFIVELLPRLIVAYERLCIRIASEGYHKPGYFLSTFALGPIGLHFWRKPVAKWWHRVLLRVFAFVLMVLAVRLFFAGCWVFALLLVFGRPLRWFFTHPVRTVGLALGCDESREPPDVPDSFFFRLTKLDKAALLFIGIILVVFFLNRDQLTPRKDCDHNYHMAVARQILDHHWRIPTYDDWEYAPAGRPHLYPPGIHVLIAALAGHPEKIAEGFETLQVITYPLALLFTWWFIRWLFGTRMGFAGVVLFSMDMPACWTMFTVLPSAVVTALVPLILMCFLSRRKKATVLLLTACLYMHLGVPPLIFVGLFLFSVRYKGYFTFFKSVLGWSLLLYLPWFLKVVLPELDWLGMPSTRIAEMSNQNVAAYVAAAIHSFLALQMISPVIMAVQFWGLRRFRHPGAGLIRNMLLGFLPMLLLYGGRYWMHTGPLWAVFGAYVLVRLVPEKATTRRIVVLLLCTMIPLPTVHISPELDVRWVPNIGGGGFALMFSVAPAQEDTDFWDLAAFIRRNTSPREIVHVDPRKNYLGDRIVTATGRRVDVGGWASEVKNSAMKRRVSAYRKIDTDCLFVYENAEPPEALGCDRVVQIGRFSVGIRGKDRPLDEQTHPPEIPHKPPL